MKSNGHRPKTYTKKDLVRKVALAGSENMNVSAKWIERVFVAVREIMMSADPDLRVEIWDFGVFEVKATRSKPKASNPKSGEIIYVPSRGTTPFKPGKRLKGFLSQPLGAHRPSEN